MMLKAGAVGAAGDFDEYLAAQWRGAAKDRNRQAGPLRSIIERDGRNHDMRNIHCQKLLPVGPVKIAS